MQKWEYKLVSADVDWEDTDKPAGMDQNRLSQLGDQGWELVGITPVTGPLEDGSNGTVEIHDVFKRLKEEKNSGHACSRSGAEEEKRDLSVSRRCRTHSAGWGAEAREQDCQEWLSTTSAKHRSETTCFHWQAFVSQLPKFGAKRRGGDVSPDEI